MASKYDQLSKLKTLLDSGALTQEEFDAAKSRILATKSVSEQQESTSPTEPANDRTTNTNKQQSLKWILIGGASVALLVIMLITLTGREDTQYHSDEDLGVIQYDSVSPATLDELSAPEDTNSYYPEESFEERFESFNPWHIDYLHNEWGEDDTSYPFLYSIISGTSWNIHIDYMPPTTETPGGLFRFYLVDNDGHFIDSYGPVNILVRDSKGETRKIEVTGTREGVTFIESPHEIELLKHYLDQETFDIQMEFEEYNERHATRGEWYCDPGFFKHAIRTML